MKESTKIQLEKFFSGFKLRKYKKGEVLYEPGDTFEGVVFVKSGYLKVYSVSKNGKETGLQLFKPTFYFSLIAAISGMKNRHYIEALGPVEIWIAPKDKFMKFVGDNRELTLDIMASFLNKFVDLTSQMVQIIAGDAYTKVAGLIYAMADEFGANEGKRVMIKFKVTHKLIASLTGLTRETVTLQMLKLEKSGYVDNKQRQIEVLDMEKLRKMLGYE